MKQHRLFITLLLVAFAAQVTLADEIKVVGQNVQNFFYSLDRGRTQDNSIPLSNYSDVNGRTNKLNAIIEHLAPYNADIYAFNEVECCAESLELLAESMSTKTGKSYLPVADGLSYDKSTETEGTIKSGFIYNTATIELVGDNVSTAAGYTFIYPNQMRMQTFKDKNSGESFSLSINHFKAGSSADDVEKRITNAARLLTGLNQALDQDILIMGDLNAEITEESLQQLVTAGYEEQLLKYYQGAMYTHCYGDGELIDHVLANETMAQQITNAEIMHIANTCSTGSKWNAYSDHDPYMVTLDLRAAPTYDFAKATSVSAGGQYLIVASLNGGLEAAKPVPTDKDYSYLYTQTVTEVNGVITLDNKNNVFTFEDAGNGQYYIKDSNNRYAYQTVKSGTTYYTTVAATTDFNNAHKYTATLQDDGTFKILSQTGYYLYGTVYNNKTPEFLFGNNANLASGNCLPWLYEYTATPTGITTVNTYTQPTVTRKVMVNGQLMIVTANGKRYTLQGIEK